MHVHRSFVVKSTNRLASLFAFSLIFNSACDTLPFGGLTTVQEDDALLAGGIAGSIKEAGDNSAFESAQSVPVAPGETITITGFIESGSDVDLYNLGAFNAGDRVTIDVKGDNGFNTVAAIFDENSDLIDANDDRSFYAGEANPYISRAIRADTSNLYLGITVSTTAHFGNSQGRYSSGTYSISVKREPNALPVSTRRQIVYLDFEGGAQVQIGLEPQVTMKPFSAEAISSRLKGKTEYLITKTVEHMRRDFAAYDVELRCSRDEARPSEPHSTLYFGNYNSKYLGLADNVDTYNVYLEQDAIVYTEDIGMFESLQPTAEETALCIANIASHELGHLLGLEHSRDPLDCMATAATARQIIENDLTFRRSQMQKDVFPIGFQNEPALLMMNVGANTQGDVARMSLADILPQPWETTWRDDAGMEDIAIMPCGRCAHAK